ncbi:midasin [Nematocida major]|uniref:midasin n=1 Tax=Nematocida major TaxID=1912982 RepID=UPI0020089BB9|nr:midasin [Nematocida major]KAH9386428.1 midasin [Nematocida major]
MNSFATDAQEIEQIRKGVFHLSTSEEVGRFLHEYETVKKLSVPVEIPNTIKAKEIVYAAAAARSMSVMEIDAEDIQDTACLVEQVHIEGKNIIRREGALVRAMRKGCWLIVNSKEKENPVTNYIVSEYETVPGTAEKPHADFQLFIFSRDYAEGCSRGAAYTMQMQEGAKPRGERESAPQGAQAAQPSKEGRLCARLVAALSEGRSQKHGSAEEAFQSVVSAVVFAIKKFAQPHEVDNVEKCVEEDAKTYYLLQMAMEKVRIGGIAAHEMPPLQVRAKLYLILRDVLLAGLKAEEREGKEALLRDMLCVRAEEMSPLINAAEHMVRGMLGEEQEYVLTKPAISLILFVLQGLPVANSFLLVGETGTGKTTTVQKIFERRKALLQMRSRDARKLLCVNLSKDTDVSDLLGSYQFATCEQLALHINDLVQGYFELFFDEEKNNEFLTEIDRAAEERRVDVIVDTAEDLLSKFSEKDEKAPTPAKKSVIQKLAKALDLLRKVQSGMQNICVFVEGPLVRAALYGYWILLDESNLAPNSTLRYINTAISRGQLSVVEDSGAVVPIDQRTVIFQCINPGDDHGKKNIEMDRTLCHWVDEVDRHPEDVLAVAQSYGKHHAEADVRKVVQFYTEIKSMAEKNGLRTGSNRQALFGVRNLIRALKMQNIPVVEAVKVNFLTQLCIKHKVLGKKLLATIFPGASAEKRGEMLSTSEYIITPQAREYVAEIESAISTGTAVLLEGTTSVGKTSLIKYMAQSRGRKVVRINNHEHTDITEYLGTFGVAYESSAEEEEASGSEKSENRAVKKQRTDAKAAEKGENRRGCDFVYKEGALVKAVREGHWVLLDELNLAPTEVLESLNRLLDSNRELFIPATQQTVRAHPDFALFASQNPAESTDYRNRKHLSKAFRNRFIEIYVEEKCREELEAVLHGMHAGKVYAKVLLDIYEALRILTCNRSHEYITLRELMKILTRFNQKAQAPFVEKETKDEERLFYYTMLILTEKIRHAEEKRKIEDIICAHFEKVFKTQFTAEKYVEALSVPLEEDPHAPLLTPCVTRTLRKMEAAWVGGENILLVGAPGIGKTYLSEYMSRRMQTPCTVLGMHAGIELSDFVGGYREEARTAQSSKCSEALGSLPRFTWRDGPLLGEMKRGGALIIDEINLVPDSVLESLNELFDDRKLRIHETDQHIAARETFRIVGTMNPGDDYGKREVGKSISTRFTTIYVDPIESNEEAVKYFLFYAQKYGLAEQYSKSELYRALHKGVARAHIQIESAREAELLARYAANCPREEAQKIDEVLLQGIELARQMPVPALGPVVDTPAAFGIHPFVLQKGSGAASLPSYTFEPPSVKETLYRILQALFCRFNLLLEGPPGTGKTKIVEEAGRRLGKRVTRVNLSSETEMADLTGRNTPTDRGIVFVEGEFVRAVARGDWIIVDEINLATQSVLEGLNGCLDYRRRIYVPELGPVALHPETVIFATMNPKTSRTDGRKLLPKSFLSRFVRVTRGPFSEEDLKIILAQAPTPCSPGEAKALAEQLLRCRETYSLNLRDCLRHMAIGSAHLVKHVHEPLEGASEEPRKSVVHVPQGTELVAFPVHTAQAQPHGKANTLPGVEVPYLGSAEGLRIGQGFLQCDLSRDPEYVITHASIPALEALIHGLNMAWPCIVRGPVGKGRAARFVARITGQQICTVSCHKDMEPSDFLGRYVKAEDEGPSPFMWEDSAFIQAVERGDLVLLKNINLVKNDVVDRLNSLFEVGGVLEIHEKGGDEPRKVITHPKTRFILTLAERAKDLSPALVNRSIQVILPKELSCIDIAKMLFLHPSRKQCPLSTSSLHKVPSGLLNAHVRARKALDYNTVGEGVLRPLLPSASDLERESPLRNFIVEEDVLAHLQSLMQGSLDAQVLGILSDRTASPESISEKLRLLVRSLSESAVEPHFRAIYTHAELYESLKKKYALCSAFAQRAKRERGGESPKPAGESRSPQDVFNRLVALRNRLESGESALRAYFEAMDMPFLPRKDVSLRMAKIKLMECAFAPNKGTWGTLGDLAILQEVAQVLDSLPGTLEKTIAALETEPPAYDALQDLITACLKYDIDPLVFPEIEKIEEASRMSVRTAVKKVKRSYYLYKYGVSLCFAPEKPVEGLDTVQKKRKERNFKKFAYYLQGVIKDAVHAEYPESLAFSLIKRDMSKYEDLWECFAYALLKSGIERISKKAQSVPVCEFSRSMLDGLSGACSAEAALAAACKALQREERSFMSLTPLHSQAVQTAWRLFSKEVVSPSEVLALAGVLLVEHSLSRHAPDDYAEGTVQYALDEQSDKIVSATALLKRREVDLSEAEGKHSLHKISVSPRVVELVDQTHLEVKRSKNLVGESKFDWGEDDGAREYLIERIQEIKKCALTTPAQKVAADLDKLNVDAIHAKIMSTPLNTARHTIYREYADINSYCPKKYTEIYGGWLLHLFSAIAGEGAKQGILYAIEEFLLQSTVGDMEQRAEIIRQMVANGGAYEIQNILVYFLPYLEAVRRKKEKVEEAVCTCLKEVQTALDIKIKVCGAIVPVREQSILAKAQTARETLESLLAPIVSMIKPQVFHRSVPLTCTCEDEACYVCMAKEVERQKLLLEKESMSVKLRSLYVLFDKISFMIPENVSRVGVVGAMDFYLHKYTECEAEHVVLAKIMHLGIAVLKVDPVLKFQLATRISDTTVRMLNYSMHAAPAEYRLILVSLGLFFELMSFGFCGDTDEDGLEGLIEELEEAGMRLGEGEKNISEQLKKEEEVGGDYQGEKDMQSDEIEEEDGVDCENAGEVQETAGAEDRPDIEVDNGSVSENEEGFNQNKKDEPAEKDSGEEEEGEGEPEDGSSEVGSGSENQEELEEINLEKEEDQDSAESLKVQEMDMCEEAGGEFDKDNLDDVEDCSLGEESLEAIDLSTGEESSEEVSIEKYESEEYAENIKQYDYAEIEANPEQLFKESEEHPDAERIGHEEGEGAEREIAVEKGEEMNKDAEDTECNEAYTGEYRETPESEEVKKALFERPAAKCVNPLEYYESVKHRTNPELTKQLSVVLEENEKSAYEGDYASGRRLNMKRIISYIASDGQKNRIWMRKTKNQGREYLIRIFVDNSGSIKNSSIVDSLIRSLSSITNSLDLLGVPFELYTFSSAVQQHADTRGLIEGLTFKANETRVSWVFEDEYRYGYNILISDGLFYDGALSRGMLSNTLLLIVGSGTMIKEMRTVKAVVGEVVIGKYLETLGIPYCIVDEDNLLEVVFCRELKNILQHAKMSEN